MCGIAGLLDLAGSLAPAALAESCAAMTDSLGHRGPDDGGVWLAPGGTCALGHRRLSILDLTAAGHQPMVAPSGSALAFNGEIYNFLALRSELSAAGWRFASHSDSEVLLAGLDLYGPAFVERLDGMYAFAFWDAKSRRLLLGRDRFGEKPLYLYRSGGILAFASELRAFTRLPDFDARIAPATIVSYLAFQYVPAPKAIYDACAKLEPGRLIEVDAGAKLRTLGQKSFTASARAGTTRPLGELADELEGILVRSVRDRLASDVRLGAFLSGGVDSATIVAIAAKRLNRSLRTFSIGFAGSPDSEHEQARAMARHLGTDHVEEMVDSADLGERAAFVAGELDEPNGDSSCLPTWHLCRLARSSVTVVLSGDGGDELFGGYGRYLAMLADRERMARSEWRPGAAYYDSQRVLFFPEEHLAAMLGEVPVELHTRLAALRQRLDGGSKPLLALLREADAAHYLPGAVLAKVDRMSMRHSLEVRAPLLGDEVADFAARLGEADCWDGTAGKRVLKEVARRFVPSEWIDRPKKGFGLPMRGWGETKALALARALLRPGGNRLAAWLGQNAIDRFLAAQAERPLFYQLWEVLVLEHWLRANPARPG